MASTWRRYWPVDLLAVVFLVVVVIFGTYLTHRQQVADRRAENQRRAICAILSNIPGHVPAEIADARRVFARAHHPGDCMPLPKVTRSPTPRAAVSPTPGRAQPTVVIVRPATPTRQSPRPAPSRTASPRPHPTRSPHPSHSPSPSPSPSPTCGLRHPLKCLGQERQ